MIKKLLFAGALALAYNLSNAQVQVWKDDFNDEDISDWTLYDDDGDGKNWGDIFKIQNEQQVPVTPISLISRSWQQVPLTPDNWAVSPAINIAGAGGALTLTWITQVAKAEWDEENYTVYVATSPDKAALLASPVKKTQLLGQGTNAGTPVNQSLDISAFLGQPQIYVAFRHHNSTDMDFISIDDVTVKATTLAVSDVTKTKVSIYPNPTTDVLHITAGSKVAAVEVFDMMGRKVSNATLVDGKIDVKNLAKGAYVLKVTAEEGSTSHKFIKN